MKKSGSSYLQRITLRGKILRLPTMFNIDGRIISDWILKN